MNVICECDLCHTRWTCRGEYDEGIVTFSLTGDQQSCPKCNSQEFTVYEEDDNVGRTE